MRLFFRWVRGTVRHDILFWQLVTVDGTQLQVTGALVALGAIIAIGLWKNKKIRFNFNLGGKS